MFTAFFLPKLQQLIALAGIALVMASCGKGNESSSSASSQSSVALVCESAGAGDGYCLVWQDEFLGTTLDQSKWSYEKNCFGGGNNEAQCYTDKPTNVWVSGGFLHLKAIRENITGPALLDDDPSYRANDQSGSGTYSSGRIRSKQKGDWRYGRFEIRAKLPSGQGTWPAIWMLPTKDAYGGWAASGEIDIMEAVNLNVGGERRVHGTLHYGAAWPDNVYSGESFELPNGANPADDFHVYALEWEEGEIRWYVDGDHYVTQTHDGWYSVAALDQPFAPFNQSFHMILNLAVGGDWAGQVNDTGINPNVFPQEMIVDYVKVYECSKDPVAGRGCGSSDGRFVSNPGHSAPKQVGVTGDAFTLFDERVAQSYRLLFWAESGDIQFASVAVGGSYGTVTQMTFNTNAGVAYFQSEANVNLSGYQAVEFDVRITSDPRSSKTPLVFRADCTFPCTSGDYVLGYPGVNTWTHYRVAVSQLVTMGLDATKVNTPFVLAPQGNNQQGVVVQVDNVKWVK